MHNFYRKHFFDKLSNNKIIPNSLRRLSCASLKMGYVPYIFATGPAGAA